MAERGSEGPGLGVLLMRAARRYDERAVARVEAESKVPVRTSHTALMVHLERLSAASAEQGVEGARLTDLAQAMGITKQAVGQLVEDLERAGVARRAEDPRDKRARLVQLTAKGERAKQHGLGILRELEAELARALGRARIERLKDDLAAVAELLDREA